MATMNSATEEGVRLIEKQEWKYTRGEQKPLVHTDTTGKNTQ